MGGRAVRRWVGKRPAYVVWRLIQVLEDVWDQWFGDLALKGVDPRRWDLHQLLAALESSIRQNCEDESEWNRRRGSLYAPPRRPRQAQRGNTSPGPSGAAQRPSSGGLALVDVEALIARAEAADARYRAV